MRVGFIGAGHIGGTLARIFARAGHEVAVSNSRGAESLQGLLEELGSRAHAASPQEVTDFAQVLVVSIPFGQYHIVPVDGTAGKVVIDTNNYFPQRDGQFPELESGRTTSSELLQQHLATAHVVKAFNTINWRPLGEYGLAPEGKPRLAVPVAGDDQQAKRLVKQLIDDLGFDVLDLGDLAEGRRIQPGSPVFGQALSLAELQSRLSVAPAQS